MNLHEDKEAFYDLAALTAKFIGIPVTAVRRDYYIVLMLQRLAQSRFFSQVVFKGGTSLSKCYPGSIKRFSEDIDLTYIPDEKLSQKQYDRALKAIEKILAEGAFFQKIPDERNDRNKSSFLWFDEAEKEDTKIKLEIGSSVRPDPYELRILKTYVQEYLEACKRNDVILEYGLEEVRINTLCIERTFLDKVMSVKRHAICGTISNKVRHIYDVTVLFDRPDIQAFLADRAGLKELLQKTKQTDGFNLEKRNVSAEYNPVSAYDFPSWEKYFDKAVRSRYEKLYEDLLYTNEKQDFEKALQVFRCISDLFAEIGE